LLSYYDKTYRKALQNREKLTELLNSIPCNTIDVKTITHKLIHEKTIA
jgi:hypothetical protein